MYSAVDFKRLERAWQKKYGIDQNSVTESISYLEKIFQLKIGIPHPNSAQIEDYLDILVKNCPDKIKKIMSHTTPKNTGFVGVGNVRRKKWQIYQCV